MGRYLYNIEKVGGGQIGTAFTIKEARDIARDYVERTGKTASILREGGRGRVTHIEDWSARNG